MKIETWLKKNTFHHGEFWDIKKLIKEKEKKGLKVSVCIPTLNEEKTIGKEIVILRSELMDRYPLIDELAVIDSGSTDDTLKVAASFGADTYLSADILPQTGFKKGKGENLWKAVHQLEGDIICYVDADIKNIHPRFVYGLVAPLIYRDEIHYVKAFYDRPLAFSSGLRPSGGGRVTEILVRPLFSLFFPELTALPFNLYQGNMLFVVRCWIKYHFQLAMEWKPPIFWMSIKTGDWGLLLRLTSINGSIETKPHYRLEKCHLGSFRAFSIELNPTE